MKILCLVGAMMMGTCSYSHAEPLIKEPNVSGQFYNDNPKELVKQIQTFFDQSGQKPLEQPLPMVIAPHAGYPYSGPVAAYSFRAVSAGQYSTIIVIAPSHFFPFSGISVWKEGGFKTPLGIVPVDDEFTQRLLAESPNFHFQPEVYEREHALEVELPFLQQTFKDFKLVPILMGQPNPEVIEELALALDKLIGERKDVLMVISTDMSHYHPDSVARAMDAGTLKAIEKGDVEEFWNGNISGTMEMCGFMGVATALALAERRHWTAEVLRYGNSGDTSGDKFRVVGYCSVIFHPSTTPAAENNQKAAGALTPEQKKELLKIARETIESFVRSQKIPEFQTKEDALLKTQGAFVTIRKKGELRGCIGQVIGREPLYLTVRDMAVSAATRDPRFDPLKQEELSDIDVEVSVLSVPHRIHSIDEIELGKHGVIVSQGSMHQGLFLPQVATETGWDKATFLSVLCAQKAGLPPKAWMDPNTIMEIFTAEVFGEHDENQ